MIFRMAKYFYGEVLAKIKDIQDGVCSCTHVAIDMSQINFQYIKVSF